MPSRIWIHLVSILVPWEDRESWIEEWEGELSATGGGMLHALGALPDAWFLRTEGWTMERLLREVRLAVKALVRDGAKSKAQYHIEAVNVGYV